MLVIICYLDHVHFIKHLHMEIYFSYNFSYSKFVEEGEALIDGFSC